MNIRFLHRYRAQLENELTRHLWYSIMARALSIFFSARGDELVAADVDADDER